jgi:multiple sugar transport system permease protein
MRKRRLVRKQILIYLAALGIVLYSVLPITWLVSTSFKSQAEILQGARTFLPSTWTLTNYTDVLLKSEYGLYFVNSLVVTLAATSIVMVCAILSGYSFSGMFRYPEKNAIMIVIILARMVPEIAIVIPMYFYLQWAGLYDTRAGIALVIAALAYPLATWLMKSFFDDIPESLYEAAKLDGCNSWDILRRIVLPISGPSISSTLIITFLTVWNSFLIPLTFAKTARSKTFPVAISELAFGEFGVSWGTLSALSVMAVIPMFLIGVFAQKYIVAGLTSGAEKG